MESETIEGKRCDPCGLEFMDKMKVLILEKTCCEYAKFEPLFYTVDIEAGIVYRIKIVVSEKLECIDAEIFYPFKHSCLEPMCTAVVSYTSACEGFAF